MIWHVHDRTGAEFTVREQVEPDDEPCPVIHAGERPIYRAVLELRG